MDALHRRLLSIPWAARRARVPQRIFRPGPSTMAVPARRVVRPGALRHTRAKATALDFGMLFPDIDAAAGTVTLAIWQSALFAGMALLLLFLAIYRGKLPDVAGTVVRVGLVMFAVAAVWGLLAQLSEHDRADERRALDRRIAEMGARALAPGPPLGCLQPPRGATLEAACEKAVFADPQSVAGTMAYVAGSLSLLSDSLAWGLDPDYDSGLAALRRRLEIDRFGLVAQVLAGQGCSAAKCETLVLFADASRVSANLKARTFENLVARHSAGWPQSPAAAPE